jgi:hypothetical protein
MEELAAILSVVQMCIVFILIDKNNKLIDDNNKLREKIKDLEKKIA